MRNCKNYQEKYLIYASVYKVENYQGRVAECNKRKERIYTSIISKYANYNRVYITNFLGYTSRHWVDIKVKKQKKIKKKEKEKIQVENINNEIEEKAKKLNLQLNTKIEIKEIRF